MTMKLFRICSTVLAANLAVFLSLSACAQGQAAAPQHSDQAAKKAPAPASATFAKSDKARNPADASPEALQAFAAKSAEVNLAIFKALPDAFRGGPDEMKGKNAVVSVFSIQQALGMTWAGAKGLTAEEMARALGFGPDAHQMLNTLSLKLLDKRLESQEDNWRGKTDAVEIAVENELWGRTGKKWQTPFLETLSAWYGAGVGELDFAQDPEGARQFINGRVAETTKKRIQDLIPRGSIDVNTALVLTNAIYFKAPWMSAFNERRTQDREFTLANGKKIQTPFVKSQEKLPYAEGKGWQAVEKPFSGGGLSMVFILPEAGKLNKFVSSLSGKQLMEITGELAKHRATVNLELPKFKFTTPSIPMKQLFRSLGMWTAFASTADFSGMDGTKLLKIDNIFHKAFIALDEKGVEAAAATAVVMATKGLAHGPPPKIFDFIADRPFLFMIRDVETGAILFFGRVMNPKE